MEYPNAAYATTRVNLDKLNMLNVKANPYLVKETYDITIRNCVPRPTPGLFLRIKAKRARTPWTLPISLFKDYIPDSDVNFLFEMLKNRHF